MSNLPENWTEHTAPTGHRYYYNSITKESTYERAKIQPVKQNKKKQQKEQTLPKFKWELPGTSWVLIFTNKGSHFFHNTVTKESKWQVDDDEVKEAVSQIEKKYLLLLIAKARGLKLDDDLEYQLQEAMGLKSKQTIVIEDEPTAPIDEEISQESEEEINEDNETNESRPSATNGVLISGYSSSDDDDESDAEETKEVPETENNDTVEPTVHIEEQEKDKGEEKVDEEEAEEEAEDEEDQELEESSDEGNGLDLAELDDISSSDEEDGTSEKSKSVFLQLLDSSSLNPYGSWEIESLKVINDPRFYEIETNAGRKEIFDEWAKSKLENNDSEEEAGNKSHQEDGNESLEDDQVDEPIIKFFKFITDPEVEKCPFFFEFKELYEDELEEFGEINDREQEKLYKEVYQLRAKPIEQRLQDFKGFLTNTKIFKKNLVESGQSSKELLKQLENDDITSYSPQQIQSLVHKIERRFNISDSIRYNPKYWSIEPEKKLQLLKEVANAII